MMDIKSTLLIIVALINFILGILVLFQNRNRKLGNIFSMVIFMVVFWCITMFGYRFYNHTYTISWCRFLYIAATLIPLTFLYFSHKFLDYRKKISQFKILFYSFPAIILIYLTGFTDFIIADAYRVMGQENIIIFGKLYLLYVIYIISYFNWSFLKLIKAYKKNTGIIREQAKYILIGAITSSLIAMSTNLILPWFNYFELNWLGQIATVLWISFTTYSMVRYRFMDVRVVFRKLFVYFGIGLFTYIMFYGVANLYLLLFGDVFAKSGYILGILFSFLFVSSFFVVNKILYKFSDKYLFLNLHKYRETLNSLSRELNHYNELEKIIDKIIDTIKDQMNLNRAGVLLINTDKQVIRYEIAKVIGFNEQNGINLVQDNFLTSYLQRINSPLVIDELDLLSRDANTDKEINGFKRLKIYMSHIEASVCLPLISNKKLIGIIVLGNKENKNSYTKEDLDLLINLASQASTAIENAQLYKKVKEQKDELDNFNKSLKIKVDEQTKDLLKQKKHLEELLVMKSDFLRIVHHQLNTPLSIMKNAFSMIKDKTLSNKKGIDIAAHGLKRMSNVILDFWDAFELEGADINLNIEETDLLIIIKEIIAEKKNLKVTIDKKLDILLKIPNFKIPKVLCDDKKTIHVISNLLENAVFYTKKGSVTVSFDKFSKNSKKYLKVFVADTGVGIRPEDKNGLFLKFSRGLISKKLNPTGSGLGLYIAKRIIDASNGELKLEKSILNQGTVFSFTLPIAGLKK